MSASSSTLRPVTVPSRRAASVSFWIWSRPWWAASMDSLRDSVYFTGLPSRRATSSAITSSGVTCSLPPKPPPTSGAMTRNLCSGISSVIANMSRRMCGIWVADHTVICGPVGSTTTERGSMNAGMSRCCRKVRCTTTSASRMACSTSPPVPASAESNVQVALMFVPRSGCTRSAPSATAAARSSTIGNSS